MLRYDAEVRIRSDLQQSEALLFPLLGGFPVPSREGFMTPRTYGLFALAGALGCSLTHSVVVPVDVVKTLRQTDGLRGEDGSDGLRFLNQDLDRFKLHSRKFNQFRNAKFCNESSLSTFFVFASVIK